MSDTVFTKIIKGEIPCHKIYEDDRTFVFLDIHPVQPGHTLVVTKTPYETFMDITGEDSTAFWNTIRKVAERLKLEFPNKKRIGLQIEGLEVAHAHAKLIPINSGIEFRAEPDMDTEPDHDELAEIAKRLAF